MIFPVQSGKLVVMMNRTISMVDSYCTYRPPSTRWLWMVKKPRAKPNPKPQPTVEERKKTRHNIPLVGDPWKFCGASLQFTQFPVSREPKKKEKKRPELYVQIHSCKPLVQEIRILLSILSGSFAFFFLLSEKEMEACLLTDRVTDG